jgi:hypothetical protein
MSEKQPFPDGWDEKLTREVRDHFEGQTEEEKAAEIEKALDANGATMPDPEPAVTSQARAGVGLRVYVALLGLGGIGMGLMFLLVLSDVPTWCRWLAYLFGPFMVAGGTVFLFYSLRGRKTDLQELTGCTTGTEAVKDGADTAATSATAQVVGEIINNIS